MAVMEDSGVSSRRRFPRVEADPDAFEKGMLMFLVYESMRGQKLRKYTWMLKLKRISWINMGEAPNALRLLKRRAPD
jgi:hypothetical protein